MVNFENKLIKKKNIDKELTLKVIQNDINSKIFVEFSSADGKLVVQKSFQSNYEGNKEAAEFQKRFKSIKDLRKYLGLK